MSFGFRCRGVRPSSSSPGAPLSTFIPTPMRMTSASSTPTMAPRFQWSPQAALGATGPARERRRHTDPGGGRLLRLHARREDHARLGLGRRGYSISADDVLAFDAAKTNAVLALRLPFRLNLREQVAARFGALAEEASCVDSEFEEGTRAPLAAVYELRRLEVGETWSRPVVRRLSPAEALIALLAHSFRFQPETRDEQLRMMADYLELVASRACLPSPRPGRTRRARRAPRRGRKDDHRRFPVSRATSVMHGSSICVEHATEPRRSRGRRCTQAWVGGPSCPIELSRQRRRRGRDA